MDENTPDPQNQDQRYQPEHSPRVWRACCLVPTLVAGLVLIIVVGAGLWSPVRRMTGTTTAPSDPATKAQRESFVSFGKSFFAPIVVAEKANKAAFDALDANVQRGGSLDDVHARFRTAADANGRAATQLRALSIPPNLQSRDKIRKSIDLVSESFDVRRDVCLLLVAWNGDMNDRNTVDKYNGMAKRVNSLTQDGLRQLAEAARDNHLTEDDARRFLPAKMSQSMQMSASPWKPGDVR